MVLRIRLARLSKRHAPHYNIVLARDRTARDSKPMEVLGTYNPLPQTPLASAAFPARSPSSSNTQSTTQSSSSNTTSGAQQQNNTSGTNNQVEDRVKRYKDIQLDITRTKYWLGVGAQVSEPVGRLLALVGILEPKPGRSKSTLQK